MGGTWSSSMWSVGHYCRASIQGVRLRLPERVDLDAVVGSYGWAVVCIEHVTGCGKLQCDRQGGTSASDVET